jgi:Myb-like DNA-binding domain
MSSRHTSSAAKFGNHNHEKISHSSSKSISQSNETLENALSANRRLQRALRNEFLTVKESIHQNRAKVAHYTNLLLQKSSPISFQQQLNAQGGFTNRNRRWTRRFFVDHRGSEPSLNLDILRRRKAEKETFFYHNQPSWSSKETAQLMAVVQTFLTADETGNLLSQSSEKMPLDHSDDLTTLESRCLGKKRVDSIDFESVAKSLAPSIQSDGDCIAERHKRTAEECQIQYYNLKSEERNKSIFDNQENMRVLSEVVSLTSSTFGSTEMDWEMIADKTANALQLQPELHHLSGWDCLVTYYRKSKTPLVQLQTASTVWTSQEDELLLKYLAAAGPQTVIDSKNSLLQNTLLPLLCRKSKKQVFTRVNQSLLNPNMTKNDWSEYEERRLTICMKIYYSLNQQDCNQIYCASTHCRGRGAKSVVDKWNRSINPDYSTRPFTREEDEALLQVMRSSISQNNASDCGNQHIGWVDLSHKFFPNRHPQRLQNRWSELATDQDIINRERAKLLKESSSKSAISDYGRKRRKLFHEL